MILPIRAQLVLWTSALILGLAAALSAFLHYRLAGYLNADLEAYTRYECQQMIEALTAADASTRFAAFVDNEIEIHPSSLRIFVQVVSETGEVLLRSSNLDPAKAAIPTAPRDPAQSLSVDTQLDDLPVRLMTVPVQSTLAGGGPQRVYLQIAFTLDPTRRVLRNHLANIVSAILVMVTLAILAGWLIAYKAMEPVRRMILKAEQVSAATLSEERLPDRGARDELDRLAQVINAMVDRLHRSVRAMQRFTADAAHELRTPLTTIGGEIELLHRRPERLTAHSLEPVLEEMARLNALCSRLLLLSSLDGETRQIRLAPLALGALLEKIVDQVRPLADLNRLRLAWRCDGDVTVSGNADLLSQVLLNLLDNAIKYTPPGGEIAVTLGRREDGTALVTVRDSGIGIAAEHLPHIFERFYRARDAAAAAADPRPGSGLGLAIAKEVVEFHRGRIRVESAPGRGTTFELTLPQA